MTTEEAVSTATKLKRQGVTAKLITKQLADAGYRTKTGKVPDEQWLYNKFSKLKTTTPAKRRKYAKKPVMHTIPMAEAPAPRTRMICLVGDAGEIMFAIKDLWR